MLRSRPLFCKASIISARYTKINTVGELVEILNEYPPDSEVRIIDRDVYGAYEAIEQETIGEIDVFHDEKTGGYRLVLDR